MNKLIWLIVLVLTSAAGPAGAKVDLAALPARDSVKLTIYNSADLTLVQDQRTLILKNGLNRLQFSWANTLIDPTSLEMSPRARVEEIQTQDLSFPPRVRNLGVWNIESRVSGPAPFEISYLTSGLSWRAFYLATLTRDENFLDLDGFVRVDNRSGEDYENAVTRLIVGQVRLLDDIAMLAQREHPHGTPEHEPRPVPAPLSDLAGEAESMPRAAKAMMAELAQPKEIAKEAVSEYFLYTIEGRETIPHGWAKRLPSFKAAQIPVVNLYKFDEDRFGDQVMRFLSFKNDQAHHLGETPIPGGEIKVFRSRDDEGRLGYEGESNFQYIPVGQEVELALGPAEKVLVKPVLMDFRTGAYLFDQNGDPAGWEETRTFVVRIKNTRESPVKIRIDRRFGTKSWKLEPMGDYGKFEKLDVESARFTLEVGEKSEKEFTYVLTTRHGLRADE
ncbi:MAG: hypothetical protein V1816_11165 [Pseudomonadota bacterium]